MSETILEPWTRAHVPALIEFITGQPWPYHGLRNPDRGVVERWLAEGAFDGEDAQTFWVTQGGERVGLVRLQDLTDPTPLLDIRVAERHRGRGVGTAALRAITDHAFRTVETLQRIEGQTREDNAAMRAVFRKCGYVKEARYRQAWPVDDGRRLDCIGYGILRSDWANGTRTSVDWGDGD